MEKFIIVGIFVAFSAIFLPWIVFFKVIRLQRKVSNLRKIIDNTLFKPSIKVTKDSSQETTNSFAANAINNDFDKEVVLSKKKEEDVSRSDTNIKTILNESNEPKANNKIKNKIELEQQLGARFPVWIGGIAMALSGLFLIKYSIENNLISPSIRIILGAILGLAMLYASKWIRSKPDFANGKRISQSLTGSGIAVLYLVSFASSRLYDLVPNFVGFIAMAAITLSALVLSLKNGPAIALMGMIGGFLTPTLLGIEPGNVFSLFVYLYFTSSGLLMVIKKTSWWWMSIPTIFISFLWVVIWLFSDRYIPTDNIYLILFLVGISATVMLSSKQKYEESRADVNSNIFKITSLLNYAGFGGTIFITGIITGKSGFEAMEWSLFGLLALGGIGLAYFNSKLYGFVPWVSMAINIVMLTCWKTSDSIFLTLTIESFAAIYY